ncbi:MAG: hypothetical protein ABFD61_08510 [Chloroherpetonaceae bacterium]
MLATANSDTLKPALIIDSTSLSAERTYRLGDTVNFTLYFHSVFPGSCFFVINIEGGLRLIDSAGQLTPSINEYLQLDTGTQSKTYLLYVQDFNPSTFDLFMNLPHNYLEYTSMEKYKGAFKYDSASNGMKLQSFDDNIDDEITTMTYMRACIKPPGPITHYIHIDGRVLYQDWNEKEEPITGENIMEEVNGLSKYPRAKSAYNEVWLFFRRAGTTILSHPIGETDITSRYPIIGGPIEGVHFAKCNDEGYFSFDFDYDPSQIYPCGTSCQPYDVLLVLSKENEALWLESPTEHIIINNVQNRYRNAPVRFYDKIFYANGGPCETPDLHINISNVYFGTDPNIYMATDPGTYDPIQNPDGIRPLQIALTTEDGNIFRHTTLSQKFLRERLTENPPADPRIPWQVHTKLESSGYAGWYEDRFIHIRTNYCNNQLISHEYGHYFDYFIPSLNIYNEGFAMFFSWAFRVWEKNTFGDFAGGFDDCEIGPFSTLDILNPLGGYNYEWIRRYDRFGNMSKMGTHEYDDVRFACYLWNLYDSKNDGNFSPFSAFAGKNNDDVDGLGANLFNFWLSPNSNIKNSKAFNDGFKDQYSASPALQESIDSIYNFMEFGQGIPRGINEVTHWMKSPNLDFSTPTITQNSYGQWEINFHWGSTNSYNYYAPLITEIIYIARDAEGHPVDGYRYQFPEYPNQEDSVIIYRSELPDDNTSYVWKAHSNPREYSGLSMPYNPSNDRLHWYKISTYNLNAGDSYIPLEYQATQGWGKISISDENTVCDLQIQHIGNKLILSPDKSYRKIIANLYDLNGQKICNLLDADNIKSRIEVDISFLNTLQLANQIFIIGFTLVDEESNINYVAKKIIFK